MATTAEIKEWEGRAVFDRDGKRIGTVDEFFADRETGQVDWMKVSTGLLGRKASFVPMRDAITRGDAIQIPFCKDDVKDAPSTASDDALTADDERELFAHYDLTTRREALREDEPGRAGAERDPG